MRILTYDIHFPPSARSDVCGSNFPTSRQGVLLCCNNNSGQRSLRNRRTWHFKLVLDRRFGQSVALSQPPFARVQFSGNITRNATLTRSPSARPFRSHLPLTWRLDSRTFRLNAPTPCHGLSSPPATSYTFGGNHRIS